MGGAKRGPFLRFWGVNPCSKKSVILGLPIALFSSLDKRVKRRKKGDFGDFGKRAILGDLTCKTMGNGNRADRAIRRGSNLVLIFRLGDFCDFGGENRRGFSREEIRGVWMVNV